MLSDAARAKRVEIVDRLARTGNYSYLPDGPMATEPTSLAALAFMAYGRMPEAEILLHWLASMQSSDGSLGVLENQSKPRWPTSLAALAWSFHQRLTSQSIFAQQLDRALDWILAAEGMPIDNAPLLGHDTRLVGWCWAEGTHSWLEPTAFCVLTLKTCGHGDHPRTREGVRLLLDRQIPGGGCNYGNTLVMGQKLLPHPQPTGLAMLALAGEPADPRLELSLRYLEKSLSPQTALASSCYVCMGLAAHDRLAQYPFDVLSQAYLRRRRSGLAPYKLALLALALLGSDNPLIINPS